MTEEDKINRRAYIRSWYDNLPKDVKIKKENAQETVIIR